MNYKKILLSLTFLSIIIYISILEYKVLYFILFLIFHETGHLISALLLGYTFKSIFILPFGISMNFKQDFIKPGDDIFISLSGPLINFVFFIVFDILSFMGYNEFTFVKNVNIILCLFNILPAGFLDGGRIFKDILYFYVNFCIGYILTYINGIILGCTIIILSFVGGINSKTLLVALLGIFIIYKSVNELYNYRLSIIKNVTFKQDYIYNKKSFVIKQIAFSYKVKIFDIIKQLSFGRYYIIYMLNEKGIICKFFESDIINAYYRYGNITFEECIKYLNTQEE